MNIVRRRTFIALLLSILSTASPIWAQEASCERPLLEQGHQESRRDFKSAFLGTPVTVDSEAGPLEIGIIDVDQPGVAEAISNLLVKSISDARQSNMRPGHLPDHLVDDVIRQYVSPEKVKTFWRHHGHRFAAINAAGEIVGTILLGIDKDTILYLNRWNNNVPAASFPRVKPEGYHQMMNLSVKHELRRSKIASVLLDSVTRYFRHLFNGKGIWMRADPPWHDKLAGLGFHHDPSMDSFLPEGVEHTLNLTHAQYNAQYRCSCHTDHAENPEALKSREQKWQTHKLQYFSFTRDFETRAHAKTQSTQQVDVLIVGGGIAGTALALQLRETNPALKTLIVSRESGFALSGHGYLYPMTGMENFRFPGENSVQPQKLNGTVYPGELERALLANQQTLDIMTGETVAGYGSGGAIVLNSGAEIQARAVVVATGSVSAESSVVAESARDKVKDFVGFARDLAQLPYINSTPGQWGTVAVLGDGAAVRKLARLLKQDRYRAAKNILLIGENVSREIINMVTYDQGKFQIHVRKENGQSQTYFADRVVTSLGFTNQEAKALAAKLNTPWIIGSAAFDGPAPSISEQLKITSEQAGRLNAAVTGVRR
jgi:hypothetical protein